MLLGGQPGWTPETLPNQRLTPKTYNEIVEKLNTELERRELSAGVELVSSGEELSLRKYKQVLAGIERLKADSEEVGAKYNDNSYGKLPISGDISKGYLVKSQEFQKIRYLLTVAEQERVHGEIEDHGNFVLVKPQQEIVGVDPQGRTFGKDNQLGGVGGVFIPGRSVKLSDYYIGKYEVTYKLWKQVFDWNQNNNKGYVFREGRKGSHGDNRNTENDPVTRISWLDCVIWCNAYTEMMKGIEHCVYVYIDTNQVIKTTSGLTPSKVRYNQTKKGYRLPTEAEWEYTARLQGKIKDNALKYGKYNYLTHLDSFSGAKKNYQYSEENKRLAWYRDNSESHTHAVGGKAPNYAGVYDMSGNVWEWCYDGLEYSSTGIFTNPVGDVLAVSRVLRGGSWTYRGYYGCMIGYRDRRGFDDVLNEEESSSSIGNLGLRVAYSQ